MTTAKTTVPKTARKRKPRPDWWPKRITEAEYSELDRDYGGLCLACGELAFGDCEPDMRNAPCEACDVNRLHGAAEARLMGALVVEDSEEGAGSREQGAGSEGTAGPVATPPAPAAALPVPAGTVRAKGRLQHRFWGDYSAVIALEFETPEKAKEALPGLDGEPWHESQEPRVLVAVVNRTALERVKLQLGGFGADVDAIDSCRTSIDYGEPFTVDVPVGVAGETP
jgi:hypothetical protein